ncbi:fumarylacetoacetate hydrolase family protein [Nocardioides zeae]|uniref:2-keto-4-pentenoate hydratase/2-oxohepta-3-ene-1,7-dioic acid hydratase in catechol pathway n=1 Tax=Nocardioides zeae TaxID=1457234 RepID=A0AAJ1X1J0_9ACTN|nr:fumarylacetoacetate hydrolase family protein [Nocardioides zeae]MDQ1105638.1 2-keto-4-pentenoate hydratase/2-oxohepta-3-ene-1,7-dioic acid hydratase in catechol pathway [Nocardioides zeae]
MQYVSFRTASTHTSVGAIIGDRVMDLGTRLPAPTAGLSPIRRLLHAYDGRLPTQADDLLGLPGFPLTDVELLPVVPDPSKVVAAPVNYTDHQAEMNQDAHIDALGVFLKAPSSVAADGATVTLPYSDRRFDQEGELALVIGRRARHVAAADALHYVAGYTCLLDMTMRGGEDRSTRKSFDTFTPVGPAVVTPDEVGPLGELRLRTWVNDELRQDADIADLIWDVPALIAYASSVMTLEVGDILTTGTPAGVGQVRDGDDVRVEISRVGRLSAKVSATGAVRSPTRGADRGPKPPASVTPVRQR